MGSRSSFKNRSRSSFKNSTRSASSNSRVLELVAEGDVKDAIDGVQKAAHMKTKTSLIKDKRH